MGAPASGKFGEFGADRPILVNAAVAAFLVALAAMGAREAGDFRIILSFAANAFYVVVAPMALVAAQPRGTLRRFMFTILIVAAAGALAGADLGAFPALGGVFAPPAPLTFAAAGYFLFLTALTPLAGNVARLSAAAPAAATLGVAGGLGFFAFEPQLEAGEAAAAAAVALALGVALGAGAGADFSRFFARGAGRRDAVASALHAGLALFVFSILTAAALFGVQTFKTNFGAIEWRVLWAAFTAAAMACAAAVFAVAGTLALAPVGERAAVDENRRRSWFAAAWRPIRRMLPPTSARAASGLAFLFVVIAIFEAGFSAPLSFIAFFLLLGLAAAITLVSLRSSLFLIFVLAACVALAGYVYAILGMEQPELPARLAALSLCAAGLAHMTLSWRDARGFWRNARDVTENALSDGLRRFLFVFGAGSASLFVSVRTFAWSEGVGAINYFMITSFISVLLAPAIMTALSARGKRH